MRGAIWWGLLVGLTGLDGQGCQYLKYAPLLVLMRSSAAEYTQKPVVLFEVNLKNNLTLLL